MRYILSTFWIFTTGGGPSAHLCFRHFPDPNCFMIWNHAVWNQRHLSLPTAVASVNTTRAETKIQFWRNFHHWLHWKLSFWKPALQPVMEIPPKWHHFRFSATMAHPSKTGWHQLYGITHWSQQRVDSGQQRLPTGVLIDWLSNWVIIHCSNSKGAKRKICLKNSIQFKKTLLPHTTLYSTYRHKIWYTTI